MDIPHTSEDDVLAQSIRARLFQTLAQLRRPATTRELAARVGRHPNTVRVQLQRLSDAGLLERRRAAQARGRPRHEWAIAADARPAGEHPQAYGELSGWLARAAGGGARAQDIERAGREIGRDIAPERGGRAVVDAMQDALIALGFAPERQSTNGDVRYVLGNCPYREAVVQNQPVVCTLHRGITKGLLDRLDRRAKLADFVAKDPYSAGCLIDIRLARAGRRAGAPRDPADRPAPGSSPAQETRSMDVRAGPKSSAEMRRRNTQ
jgi:predicted ArsR family transcriptional regulator